MNFLIGKNRLPDLVFAPTLAFIRFSEDLLLRYAMITARTPARRLTWILLPAPGLDFQPQTQTAFYILARRLSFCKIFLLGHTVCVPVNGAKNCINARKVTGSGHCRLLRRAASPLWGIPSSCAGRLHRCGAFQALVRGGFTAAVHSKLLRGAASPLRGMRFPSPVLY